MSQKGFINIILVIIVVALVSAGAYFVSTRQDTSPTPSHTPTPTPNPAPNPSLDSMPTPSPTPQSQGITLLSQNTYDQYILGTRLKISWNISSKLSSSNYVLISLLGPNDSSKQAGRIALIPVNHASGEYAWTSSAVTVNGKNYQVGGDRRYWINISLYNGNPDSAGAVKIGEDTSDASFSLEYGGPPIEQ